ncbi:magnesium ion transporter [Stygiomarasmius scandens]|uniref:Magnesium ion transporter n=1 Tax=Marasmiellus scandens TaxID=2682957 RepID=A0ABR1JBQ0_9AGAR
MPEAGRVVKYATLVQNRAAFWNASLPREPSFLNTPMQQEEEAGKAAILEKVVKGRQPKDLMLRCMIVDAEDNVKTISGRFKRMELSTEHQLNILTASGPPQNRL